MSTVVIDLQPAQMVVRPRGWHRVASLKTSIDIPVSSIVDVGRDPRMIENGPVGLRFPGTNIPGMYIAGTFRKFLGAEKSRSFWIRRHPEQCITIQLRDHQYTSITVEVDDPDAEIARITTWLNDHRAGMATSS